MSKTITVETDVKVPAKLAWNSYTLPEHITKWNAASPDWHCSKAENDLQAGGAFSYTMAARDGSQSFNFSGVYNEVTAEKYIAYTMDDGREASVSFTTQGDSVHVSVTFEPEHENTEELQRHGWQSILNNFKKYTESM